MRLGRSYSRSLLGRPSVVFAPAAPTSAQQKIGATFGNAVATRAGYERRFPLQGWTGGLVIHSGVATEYDKNSPGAPNVLLGPRPPRVVARVPALKQQTLTVMDQPVFYRRATDRRRFPLQGYTGATRKVTTLSDGGTSCLPVWQRLLGPEPPQLVTPLPTQRQQTVLTRCVARQTRTELQRRAPNSALSSPAVLLPGQVWQHMQTLDVALAAVARATAANRLKPHWDLFSPTVLAQPPPVDATVAVTLARTRPRPTNPFLSPPAAAAALAPALTVWLHRVTARSYRSSLRPPTSVIAAPAFVASPVTVTLARTQRRPAARSRLAAGPVPAAAPVPLPPPATRQIVAVRVRAAAPYRRAMRSLGAPAVVAGAAVYPGVRGAPVRARPRKTWAKLSAPAVAAAAPAPVATELAVALARRSPRTYKSRLSPPAAAVPVAPPVAPPKPVGGTQVAVRARVYGNQRYWVEKILFAPMVVSPPGPVETAITVVTVAGRARPVRRRSAVRPPATVAVAAPPTLRQQTVAAFTVETRPRTVSSSLPGPAPTVAVLPVPVSVTLSRPVRRRTRSLLSRPAPAPRDLARPLAVAPARIRPRPVRSALRAPQPATPFDSSRGRIRAVTALRAVLERRKGRWTLRPPATVAATPLPSADQRTIGVHWLAAVRDRTGRIRRTPHPRLYTPAAVRPKHPPVSFECGKPAGGWAVRPPAGVWKTGRPAGSWKTGRPGP